MLVSLRFDTYRDDASERVPPPVMPPQQVILSVESRFVSTSSPVAGSFECSSELYNRIHAICLRAIRSNTMSIITDCPHREKRKFSRSLSLHQCRFSISVSVERGSRASQGRDPRVQLGAVQPHPRHLPARHPQQHHVHHHRLPTPREA
jgi:hypothetical protein